MMANEEQLEILRQGVQVWHIWRRTHPNITLDLAGAELQGVNLIGVNFQGTNLYGANLQGTNLYGALLIKANLERANLIEANLERANLIEANLQEAFLTGVSLQGANLQRTNLTQAVVGNTTFGNVDLREVRGLDSLKHLFPSTIGIDTIYRSEGHIPETFLKDAGVPDTFITYMHSLTVRPIEYYSCFISYASKDQSCVERLYTDLRAAGVRCWYAPEDLKIGERIRVGIDESIRLHDKLLLVLSKHSVASDWVEKEVETAMEKERQQRRTVLFPVRLDDAVMKIETGWPADIRRGRSIGDFRKWKQHNEYQKALQRLLRDLAASEQNKNA